jgi:hypothetical protein
MILRNFRGDDRAVSIAVTHVLTIGITTILITGLLVGASGLLESEKQGATRDELRTIGNRMVSEMSSAYYSSGDGPNDRVVVRVSHPEYVAGNNYNVELRDSGCSAPAVSSSKCLVLQTPTGNNEVVIPIDPQIELQTPLPEVNGGSFYILVEDTDGDDDVELTLQKDAPSPSPSFAPLREVRR